ncbi:MAG: hypothetical protein ABIJ09_14730 [Pseudomonadota bacterium]
MSSRGMEQVFYSWTVLEHPGVSQDTTLDLDLAASRATTHFAGSIAFPDETTGDYFEHAITYMRVLAGTNGELFIGAVTRGDVSSDGLRYEYEGEYVPIDGLPIQQFFSSSRYDLGKQAYSGRRILGAPGPADQYDAMLEPPLVAPPPIPGIPHSLGGSLSWQRSAADLANPGLYQEVSLNRRSTGGVESEVWLIYILTNAQQLRFPALPSSVNRTAVLGTEPLSAYVVHWDELEEDGLSSRWAGTGPFDVNP